MCDPDKAQKHQSKSSGMRCFQTNSSFLTRLTSRLTAFQRKHSSCPATDPLSAPSSTTSPRISFSALRTTVSSSGSHTTRRSANAYGHMLAEQYSLDNPSFFQVEVIPANTVASTKSLRSEDGNVLPFEAEVGHQTAGTLICRWRLVVWETGLGEVSWPTVMKTVVTWVFKYGCELRRR